MWLCCGGNTKAAAVAEKSKQQEKKRKKKETMEDIVDASLPDRDSKLAYTYTFLYIHISQSAFHSNVFIVLEKKLTFNSWN